MVEWEIPTQHDNLVTLPPTSGPKAKRQRSTEVPTAVRSAVPGAFGGEHESGISHLDANDDDDDDDDIFDNPASAQGGFTQGGFSVDGTIGGVSADNGADDRGADRVAGLGADRGADQPDLGADLGDADLDDGLGADLVDGLEFGAALGGAGGTDGAVSAPLLVEMQRLCRRPAEFMQRCQWHYAWNSMVAHHNEKADGCLRFGLVGLA
jgi:hypothetical protein